MATYNQLDLAKAVNTSWYQTGVYYNISAIDTKLADDMVRGWATKLPNENARGWGPRGRSERFVRALQKGDKTALNAFSKHHAGGIKALKANMDKMDPGKFNIKSFYVSDAEMKVEA